jgi:hypothetical protein
MSRLVNLVAVVMLGLFLVSCAAQQGVIAASQANNASQDAE